MPKRAVIYAVQVFRDGQAKIIKAGTNFNFTADEIDDIKKGNPKALRPVPVEDLEVEAKLAETPEEKAARVQAEAEEAARVQKANDKAVADKEAADKQAVADKAAAAQAVKDAEANLKATKAGAKSGKGSASADSL